MPGNRTPEYLTTHILAGERLVFALDPEAAELTRGIEHGRHGVTLVKEGALRVVMVAMKPGNRLGEHAAVGPTTVLVLNGRVKFTMANEELVLLQHQLVAFGPNVRHDALAEEDSTLLITVVMPQET